jgi:hypothetical protein
LVRDEACLSGQVLQGITLSAKPTLKKPGTIRMPYPLVEAWVRAFVNASWDAVWIALVERYKQLERKT